MKTAPHGPVRSQRNFYSFLLVSTSTERLKHKQVDSIVDQRAEHYFSSEMRVSDAKCSMEKGGIYIISI